MINDQLLNRFYNYFTDKGYKIYYNSRGQNNGYIFTKEKSQQTGEISLKQDFDFFKSIYHILGPVWNITHEFRQSCQDFALNELTSNIANIDVIDILKKHEIGSLFIIENFKNNKTTLNFLIYTLYINDLYHIKISNLITNIVPILTNNNLFNEQEIDDIILTVYNKNIRDNEKPINRDAISLYYKDYPERLNKLIEASPTLKSSFKYNTINDYITSKKELKTNIIISLSKMQFNFFIDYFSLRQYGNILNRLAIDLAKQENIDVNIVRDSDFLNITFTHNNEKYSFAYFNNIVTDFFKFLQHDVHTNSKEISENDKHIYISNLLPSWLMKNSLNQSILGHDNYIKKNKI